MSYVVGKENWLKLYRDVKYRRKVWIYALTSDDKEIFIDEYEDWPNFQSYIDDRNVDIVKIGLQYKTNLVQHEVGDAEAVYVIRSVKGQLHGSTLQCYTIGLLRDGKVDKRFYIVPSLTPDIKCVDDFEECFKEAFVYNVRQGKTV